MNYRLTKSELNKILTNWNTFLHKKIHLIACGGTALTLLDIKESTIDIDFMIPINSDYNYLIKNLQDLGYVQITGSGWKRKDEIFIFDLFQNNCIHTTKLIESPLIKEITLP